MPARGSIKIHKPNEHVRQQQRESELVGLGFLVFDKELNFTDATLTVRAHKYTLNTANTVRASPVRSLSVQSEYAKKANAEVRIKQGE